LICAAAMTLPESRAKITRVQVWSAMIVTIPRS
jgi:hypothetical protein